MRAEAVSWGMQHDAWWFEVCVQDDSCLYGLQYATVGLAVVHCHIGCSKPDCWLGLHSAWSCKVVALGKGLSQGTQPGWPFCSHTAFYLASVLCLAVLVVCVCPAGVRCGWGVV